MMLGENFLDYSIISQITPFDSVKARYHSMLGVEIGVGFTVTCSMFLIYANLSSNGHMKDGI
ncbi:MAG: hypothetical protein HRT89_20785, partial [Lentisphaeria bacterium]|nr:hypothetical protein [Lentisphaeria bacterium]